MALVSIVTPAFRAERSLAATLESIQAQSFRDWECLVVDDASPDRTTAVADAAAAGDGRIRPFRHETNRGVAAARNTALAAAGGRYLCFIDADDLWLPRKLERQLAFMTESGAALSYTAYRRIDETGRRVGRLIVPPAAMTYRQLLKNTAIATLTSMVDRERSGSFTMQDRGYDDFALWLSLLRRGCTARGLAEDLARYRVAGGSLSSRHGRAAAWTWGIYREEERLGLADALWCFGHYAARALWKRRRF